MRILCGYDYSTITPEEFTGSNCDLSKSIIDFFKEENFSYLYFFSDISSDDFTEVITGIKKRYNMNGITSFDTLYRYDFETREWVPEVINHELNELIQQVKRHKNVEKVPLDLSQYTTTELFTLVNNIMGEIEERIS